MSRRSARPPLVPLPDGGGLLLVDKPPGVTSHDVVGRVRAVLGTRRVGHAGTLDPMATGLLVLAVQRCTRLLGHLALTDKTYLATVRLGMATDTDDADGTPIDGGDASGLPVAAIDAGLRALTGELQQVPSTVSAIKVDGRRSYELARSGESVELPARPVVVDRFDRLGEIRSRDGVVDLDVVVECSTGTYVRALARDLGAALGVGGHLTALRRTRVGPFTVDDAVGVFGDAFGDAFGTGESGEPAASGPAPARPPIPSSLRNAVGAAVMPAAAAAAAAFRVRRVDAAGERDLSFGRALPAVGIAGTYAVLDDSGDRLLGLVAERGDLARPVVVFAAAG